ncbi:hypothetical protein [Amycolatopsis sp. cmx-4-83]|uniref:hypothetical protein n=1 Tax=Amycolatopsis sp. cmx-4-83 TaxID=2790940 RepID=UPI00397D4C59
MARQPAVGVLVLGGVALLAGGVGLAGWVDWPAVGRWARPHAPSFALFAVGAGLSLVGGKCCVVTESPAIAARASAPSA